MFGSEAQIENLQHFVQSVDTFLEVLRTTTFGGILAFAANAIVLSDWHAADDGGNISLADQAVLVEVVHAENELQFLVEGGTVKI